MTKREKKKFIRELCDNVRDDLLHKIGEAPDAWDGHELRVLIARRFDMAADMSLLRGRHGLRLDRRRLRAFNNFLLISRML